MKIITMMILSIFWISAAAENYYVSNSGNDSNSGTGPGTAWRTLEKVSSFQHFRPGDNIYFKRGETFFGSLEIKSSGSKGDPITIGAYGSGNNPVITGFTTVQSWINKGGNIWESSEVVSRLPKCNVVSIGGVNVPMGRFPNSKYATIQSHVSHISLSSSELTGTANWSGGEVVVKSSQWTLDRATITGHTGNRLDFAPTTYQVKDGFGFFIQNHLKTLDVQNEWYYNGATGKIFVYSAGQPKDVKVASVENLITIHGKYLVFENLNISGSNRYGFFNDWPEMLNPVIRYCKISFSGQDAIKVARTPGILITNNEISNSNNIGIHFFNRVQSPVVSENTISNTGVIPGMGQSGDISYTAIASMVQGAEISNNRIIHSGYNGIFCVGDSFVIKNNFIDTFCTVLQDGGGIFTDSKERVTFGKKIVGNIVLHGIGTADGANEPGLYATGIYLDDHTANVEIAGNSAAYCSKGGIFLHNSYNLNIHDNTFFGNEYQIVTQYDKGNYKPLSGSIIKNNIYFSKLPTQLCGYFSSFNYNFKSWGTVDSNLYVRPIADNFIIRTLSWEPYNEKFFTVNSWNGFSSYDKHSSKSPVSVPGYTYTKTGGNKVANGNFQNGISGVSKWSANGNLLASWDEGKLDGGALKLSYASKSATNTSPIFSMPVGAVSSGKKYVLKFSALSTLKNQTIHAFLKIKIPYKELTIRIPALITEEKSEHEILFEFPKDAAAAELTFTWNDKELNEPFWIDNLEFYEVTGVTKTNPDDYIRFEYNNTAVVKTIVLAGTYVDSRGKLYSGQVSLSPFSSVGLIKTTKQTDARPVADAGKDQTIVLPVNQTLLEGKGSGAAISSYQWRQVKGASAATFENSHSANTRVSALTEGIYQFELTVTDDKGYTDQDTLQVTVKPAANRLPAVDAGDDLVITLPVNSVHLSGSASDPDGTIQSWKWSKIQGPSSFNITDAVANTTEVGALTEGVYFFELMVKDNAGGAARDTVKVEVRKPANRMPVADAGKDIVITLPLSVVTLSGSGKDEDGKISQWQWAMVTGEKNINIVNPESPVTDVSNLGEGVYVFELKVTDNSGAVGRDTVKVTVNAKENILPKSNAGKDLLIVLPVASAVLYGSGSDEDGSAVRYYWRQVSGPSVSIIRYADSNQASVSGLVPGDYIFELTVTDNRGGMAKDTMMLTVARQGESRQAVAATVFPNPVQTTAALFLHSKASVEDVVIVLSDVKGRKMLQKVIPGFIGDHLEAMDMATFGRGIYFVTVYFGREIRQTIRVVKL